MLERHERSRFLRRVAEIGGLAEDSVDPCPNRVEVPSIVGRSFVESVSLQPVRKYEVSEIVTVRTELPDGAVGLMDDEMIDVLNRFALLGALIRDGDSGTASVVSRLSLYHGQEDAWELYLPMVGTAALLQSCSVQAPAAFLTSGSAGLDPGELREDGPSRWTRPDFDLAVNMIRFVPRIANADDTGMVAEFPWEPGSLSAVKGDVTSLLTFSSDTEHPVLGNGLLCRLELPAVIGDGYELKAARGLNRMELEAVDAPPFFGAWCTAGPASVAHVSFWPNMLYRRGTVVNLAAWMDARNKLAKKYMDKHFNKGA